VIKIFLAGFAAVALLWITGCTSVGSNNVYFAGFNKHRSPTSRTNEGNMELFGFSKDYKKGDWGFETGVNTYVDSYEQQSYSLFSKISHEKFRTKYITPVVAANCTYKGRSYDNDSMKTICSPLLSLRIGTEKGIFGYITAVPKVGKLTNGFVMLELGYRFVN
jgi:hypothetical protein